MAATSITVQCANGGLFVDAAGSQQQLSGPDKVAQDVAWALLSPFDSLTGQGNEMLGDDGRLRARTDSAAMNAAEFTRAATQALNRLAAAQRAQGAQAEEQIASTRVTTKATTETTFEFYATVVLVNGTGFDLNVPVQLQHLARPRS